MNDIPDWTADRAKQLAIAETTLPDLGDGQNLLALSAYTMALRRMIAKHEQPPVDPDREAVNRIFAAFYGDSINHGTYLPPEMLARAVSQYKQEKANG